MSKYDDLLQEVADYRANIQKGEEKLFLDEIKEEYNFQKRKVDRKLESFHLRYEKDGKITQAAIAGKPLNDLVRRINNDFGSIYFAEDDFASKGLKKAARDEYLFYLFFMSGFIQTRNKKLTDKEINRILAENWAGENYKQTLKRKKQELSQAIKRDILRATAAAGGATLLQLKKEVNNRIEQAEKHALLVYQNEQTRKRNMAAEVAFENEGVDEVYQWVADLSDRTCPICSTLDGKRFKKEKLPPIPAHVRCRCRAILVVPGWNQTTRRARDMDSYKSYVTNAKNYEEWKKEQGL